MQDEICESYCCLSVHLEPELAMSASQDTWPNNGGRERRCIIIGAGPAGLTAAYELAQANVIPLVLEQDSDCRRNCAEQSSMQATASISAAIDFSRRCR